MLGSPLPLNHKLALTKTQLIQCWPPLLRALPSHLHSHLPQAPPQPPTLLLFQPLPPHYSLLLPHLLQL